MLRRREGGGGGEQDLIFWSWWEKKEALFTGSEGEIEQDAVLAHRPPAETIFLPDEVLFIACRSGPYITGAVTHRADAARSEATVPSDAALIYLRNLLKGCAEIACSSSRCHGEGCEAAEVTEQRTATLTAARSEDRGAEEVDWRAVTFSIIMQHSSEVDGLTAAHCSALFISLCNKSGLKTFFPAPKVSAMLFCFGFSVEINQRTN